MGTATKVRRQPRKWADIKNETMSPGDQKKARALAVEMLAALPLGELRKARELTQDQLADALDMPQGNISKLERRVDMYESTLRRYIRAMGGELEIVARFPNADIRIELFEDIAPIGQETRRKTGRAVARRSTIAKIARNRLASK